jgi:hypothetical protein
MRVDALIKCGVWGAIAVVALVFGGAAILS